MTTNPKFSGSTATQLWQLDACEISALIRNGCVSSREVTEAVLARNREVNPKVNAVVLTLEKEALAAADAADKALAEGAVPGLLHGIPVTTKINVDQAGVPTDNGLLKFKDLIAPEDGSVVGNLRKAGAVIVGRTNAPALSLRGQTSNSLHGATLNPWNPALTAGGSSGGAGVAVAVGIGPISQGNDIGGSIRWPAYCNGVLGLRPTQGRIPFFNPTATTGRMMASQLMAVNGPLARTVRDLRLSLEAMSARDPRDPLWVPVPLDLGPSPRRVALVTRTEGPPVSPGTWAAVRQAGRYLEDAGYHVEEVSPPAMHEAWGLLRKIMASEVTQMLLPRLDDLGDPVFAQVLRHRWANPEDFRGYCTALASRDMIVHKWQMFFEKYPIVVMPASIGKPVPLDIDLQGAEGLQRQMDAMYFQAILPPLGLPGLAVPVGMDEGMPGGVQLVSARWREDLLLKAAEVIEAREGVRMPIEPRPNA